MCPPLSLLSTPCPPPSPRPPTSESPDLPTRLPDPHPPCTQRQGLTSVLGTETPPCRPAVSSVPVLPYPRHRVVKSVPAWCHDGPPISTGSTRVPVRTHPCVCNKTLALGDSRRPRSTRPGPEGWDQSRSYVRSSRGNFGSVRGRCLYVERGDGRTVRLRLVAEPPAPLHPCTWEVKDPLFLVEFLTSCTLT